MEAFASDPGIGGAEPTGPSACGVGAGSWARAGEVAPGRTGTGPDGAVPGPGRGRRRRGRGQAVVEVVGTGERARRSAAAAASAGGAAAAAVSRAPAVEVGAVDLARDRRLPVLPALEALLPGAGLRRGTTVAVGAAPGVAGATSLALALAAGASQAGSWVAAVGLGSLGLVAAAELGVALERLVMVAEPGRDREGWASVMGALVDGFDIVLVAALGRLRPADARRLVARVRERGRSWWRWAGTCPASAAPCA